MAKQAGQEAPGADPQDTPKERVLVDKLIARGLEIDVEDDDSLLGSMEQLLSDRESAPPREDYERLKKLEPFATEYTQHAADFQKWKAEQAKRQEAPKEDEQAPPTPPKIDPAAAQVVQAGLGTGKVTRTSSGLYETADPSFMPFVQQVNAATMQRREFFQRFEDDPGQFVAQYAEPHIKKLKKQYEDDLSAVKEEMKALRKRDSESSIEKYFERNYQEYWVTGEDGQIVRDAQGQGVLSPRGRLYSQAMQDLAEDIPDESKRHERAVALAKQVPVESATTAEPADRKKRFLKRASEKPGRTTNRLVEQPSAKDADKEVTAGKKRGRMDWDELMRVTEASMS